MTALNAHTKQSFPAKPMDEMTRMLIRQLARQQMDFMTTPFNFNDMTKDLAMVMASNGLFRVHRTPIAYFVTKERDFGDNAIDYLDEMKEGIQLRIPKIPFKYLMQILTFYRDVHKKDKTEAASLFFWNHNNVAMPSHYPATTAGAQRPIKGLTVDGQLILYCPEQLNTSGNTVFKDDPLVPWLRQNCSLLCEIHSH